MTEVPSFAATAFLMADNARALMLMALFDGSARPAGELAHAAGITAQTASAHLAKLVEGGLLTVERSGRHRYFRLSGPNVAEALEKLGALGCTDQMPRRRLLTREQIRLRFCRCCYDHLAGQVGVGLAEALLARGYIHQENGGGYSVSEAGMLWLGSIGIEFAALRRGARGLVWPCLDWTERRHHLAGPLANALLARFSALGWMRRSGTSRAVEITPAGWLALRRELDIDRSLPEMAATG